MHSLLALSSIFISLNGLDQAMHKWQLSAVLLLQALVQHLVLSSLYIVSSTQKLVAQDPVQVEMHASFCARGYHDQNKWKFCAGSESLFIGIHY